MPIVSNSHNFFPPFHENVQKAIAELLSDKHLYQSVRINVDFVEEIAPIAAVSGPFRVNQANLPALINKLKGQGSSLFESCEWVPDVHEVPAFFGMDLEYHGKMVPIQLPTILTECHTCKTRWPFNPVPNGSSTQAGKSQNGNQWFLFSYECQTCKGEPVRFLVRRQKQKLTLCGRDPMEPITVPDVIPRDQRDRFGNAIIAYQSGQILSAIFGLRVFIEQHWRSIDAVSTEIAGIPRPTGDEMGAAYKTTLPDELKKQFPTLCECYDELSKAMHLADESPEVYERVYKQIVLHFRALQLFSESPLSALRPL